MQRMNTLVRRLRAEHGVVGANLVIVIAFALFAVIQLTRTLLAASQIDDRVKVIVGEVGPIDTELDEVAKLDETARMAEEILAAAQPLSGQAGQIVDFTATIDQSATSILNTVGPINSNVNNILGNVGPINSSAKDINADLSAILPEVQEIDAGVAAINGRASVVIDQTIPIQGDLANISRLVESIDVSARSICNSPAINGGC
jgi:methyl-accepting chemotaxis protein